MPRLLRWYRSYCYFKVVLKLSVVGERQNELLFISYTCLYLLHTTPHHVAEVIHGYERLLTVFRKFFAHARTVCTQCVCGWARMWDATLNFGVQHTRALQMLSRVMSHHGRGDHPCPLCDAAPLDAVMSHVLRDHCMELGLGLVTDSEQLLHRFVDLDLTFLAKFRNLYKY